MSDVLETIKSRRSIRKYRSDMIPQDKLEKIIEAGTYAATGMGKQSPIIIAVTNKELRDKLSAMNAKIMGVDYTQRPVTYAGGVGSMEDLKLLKKHGKDRLDVTVGSALDLFGGTIPFETLKNLDDLHI